MKKNNFLYVKKNIFQNLKTKVWRSHCKPRKPDFTQVKIKRISKIAFKKNSLKKFKPENLMSYFMSTFHVLRLLR